MSILQLPDESTVNAISFPGLGLDLRLNRVAFLLFGHPIYWYGLIIGIGFLLAVLWCTRRAGRYGLSTDTIYDLLIYEVPLCLVGSRAYYVLFYLDNYRRADGTLDWGAMVRITDGGIAIYGTVIVSLIVLLVFCRRRKISFLAFADLGVQGLLIGQIVGRWGNFMNVEAYGSITDLPWRMSGRPIAAWLQLSGQIDKVETYHKVYDGTLGVHPTFLYESLWNLAGLILICVIAKKLYRFDGQLLLTYLFWYGLGRHWIEGLRTDSLYFFGFELFGAPVRVSQALAFLSAAVAGGVLLYLLVFRRGQHRPLYAERLAQEQAAQEEETAQETEE